MSSGEQYYRKPKQELTRKQRVLRRVGAVVLGVATVTAGSGGIMGMNYLHKQDVKAAHAASERAQAQETEKQAKVRDAIKPEMTRISTEMLAAAKEHPTLITTVAPEDKASDVVKLIGADSKGSLITIELGLEQDGVTPNPNDTRHVTIRKEVSDNRFSAPIVVRQEFKAPGMDFEGNEVTSWSAVDDVLFQDPAFTKSGHYDNTSAQDLLSATRTAQSAVNASQEYFPQVMRDVLGVRAAAQPAA